LLEGVVDRGLVVQAWLLQHVVEHVGASRGALKGPCGSDRPREPHPCRALARTSRRGFLSFLLRLCFGRGSLDLLPSTGASSTRFLFLPSRMPPPPRLGKRSKWTCQIARWSRPAGSARACA
jgi:hypothetical protein